MTRPAPIQTSADHELLRTVQFRAVQREHRRRPRYAGDTCTLHVGERVTYLWRYSPSIWDFIHVKAIVLQIESESRVQILAQLACGDMVLWVDVERLRPVKKR